MTSRSSRPARCQHKSSAPCSLCQPVRCQHKSSTSCSLCQRERNDLQQVGAWARGSRNTSIDNASFFRDNPEALRTTPPKTAAQPHSQSQSQSQQQSEQHTQPTQRPYNYKHHPSISPPSTILSPRYSHAATPSSSIAATRPVSPITLRTVPIYNARQTLPATTNAAVVASGNLRTLTPQTASRLGAHLAANHVVASDEEESEEESDEESEEDSDDDDDE